MCVRVTRSSILSFEVVKNGFFWDLLTGKEQAVSASVCFVGTVKFENITRNSNTFQHNMSAKKAANN